MSAMVGPSQAWMVDRKRKRLSFEHCDNRQGIKRRSENESAVLGFYGKGKSLIPFYEPLNVVSEGNYGVVYRARDKRSGELVAMKLEKDGLCYSTIREMKILGSLPPHPSIVGFKKMIQDDDERVFVVMEFLPTNLRAFLNSTKRALSQRHVKNLVKQILEGVAHLHRHRVMHRDLKPENILMNASGQLKICDFGLSRGIRSESGSYTPGVVTLWYRAPEVLIHGAGDYSEAIDMWSVGCIMAELLIRRPLFRQDCEIRELACIHDIVGSEKLRCMFSTLLTRAGFDLLKKLLSLDPKQRITGKDALNHAWFKEY